VLSAGQRHPLGAGAGSLALLAAMPDQDIKRVIEANAALCKRKYPRYTPEALLELVERTRNAGYALNEGWIVEDSWAVGVAIVDMHGQPVAALSISAISSRMAPARQQELAALLNTECRLLSEELQRSQTVTAVPRHHVQGSAPSATFNGTRTPHQEGLVT
jgi:DNA-binding IclR family transcriptional regulator